MTAPARGLTVAVTGPTGTFGFGLLPLLQQDDSVARVVGITRRPFDPDEHGWTKREYRAAAGTSRSVYAARELGFVVLPLPAAPRTPRRGCCPRCRSCRRSWLGSRR